MIFDQELQSIGLHKSEIAVYTYLLENGLSTPPQIAKRTKIARSNCYNILQSLKDKGLILEQTKAKRKAYIASDPDALLRSIEQKKEAVARILPDLRALYTVQKNKPKIAFFDGVEQIKELYWRSLNTQRLYAIGSTQYLSDLMPEFFEDYMSEIKKRQIIFTDILTHPSKPVADSNKAVLKALYEAKFLPKAHQDFPTDILIWGDNIALVTLEEPIFGTLITSPPLAKTFQILFSIMWDGITTNI